MDPTDEVEILLNILCWCGVFNFLLLLSAFWSAETMLSVCVCVCDGFARGQRASPTRAEPKKMVFS